MNKTRIEWGKYILIYCPDHPFAKSKGHIYEHRYIMEKHLKRFLNRKEHVHHKNGICNDNRIENLEVINNSHHAVLRDKNNPEKISKGTLALKLYQAKHKLAREKIQCITKLH